MKYLIIADRTDALYQRHAALLRSLAKHGELVIAAAFSGGEDALRALGCRLLEVPDADPGIRLLRDRKLIRRYKEILCGEKPDKVISYSAKANTYSGTLCCRFNIPYYVNIGKPGGVFADPALQWLELLIYKYALRKVRAAFFENAETRLVFVTAGALYANSTVLLGEPGGSVQPQMTEQSIVILTMLALQNR